VTYNECIDKALWLINNGYTEEPYHELVEKLWSINNKDKVDKDSNPHLPLNNNN
jgi:hypothetical protein